MLSIIQEVLEVRSEVMSTTFLSLKLGQEAAPNFEGAWDSSLIDSRGKGSGVQ